MSIATVTDKRTNVEFGITLINKDDERPVEMMVGKAMCAYYNWRRASDRPDGFFFHSVSEREREIQTEKFQSEYEATVRCISMFAEEPTSYICGYIIARAEDEFRI